MLFRIFFPILVLSVPLLAQPIVETPPHSPDGFIWSSEARGWSLVSLGIAVGSEGGPQTFDLSGELPPPTPGAPFPFVPSPELLDAYDTYYPLTFGDGLGNATLPLSHADLGRRFTGSLSLKAHVDAWGTLAIPAGSYAVLRVHIHAAAELEVVSETGEATSAHHEIDQYSFFTPHLGNIATVAESRVRFSPESGLPDTDFSSVQRLQRAPVTTVHLLSWGQVKHHR